MIDEEKLGKLTNEDGEEVDVEPGNIEADIANPSTIEYEADPDELICPDGFPPDDWATMGLGNRRAYIAAIENTKKLTGGA